jgi:hypothetical protein
LDIAHHFLVKQDGAVYEAQPMLVRSSAASGGNIGAVNIELEGNFNLVQPKSQQLAAVVALVKAIRPGTGIQFLSVHRDVGAAVCEQPDYSDVCSGASTQCSGANFNQGVRDLIARSTGLIYKGSP